MKIKIFLCFKKKNENNIYRIIVFLVLVDVFIFNIFVL